MDRVIQMQRIFIHFWSIFENYSLSKSLNNQVPGDAFEIIFAFILDYENIEIFSMDEQVKGIDFVKPDFITKNIITLYHAKPL